MGFKVLHTSDWHLGRRFLRFTQEEGLRLSRARLEAVKKLLGIASSHRVDAILCAGDLFDAQQPESHWWRPLLELLKEHPDSGQIFLLPGNHDPLTSVSLYHPRHSFRQSLPEWVHVVDRDDYCWEFGGQAVLYGVPCCSQAGDTDPLEKLPAREPGDERIRIALVHGQVLEITGAQAAFPIQRRLASERGFDYVALGDYHGWQELRAEGSTVLVYPGTPEPTNFGEKNTGQVALAFFKRGGLRPLVQSERVGEWTWKRVRCHNLLDLQKLRNSEDLTRCVLDLTVETELPLAEYEAVERILEELQGTAASHGRVGMLLLDRNKLALSLDRIEDAFESLPDSLQQVVERLRGQPGPTARRALLHLRKLVRRSVQP